MMFPGTSLPWSIAEDIPVGEAGTQEVMLVQNADVNAFLVAESFEIDKGDANITSVELAWKDENAVLYRLKFATSFYQSGPVRQVSPVRGGHLVAVVISTAASVAHPRIIANGGTAR